MGEARGSFERSKWLQDGSQRNRWTAQVVKLSWCQAIPEGRVEPQRIAGPQLFMWTFVLIFAWLYRLVKTPDAFPELPNQALLLMGISGAAYLGAKQQGIKAQAPSGKEPVQK